MPLTGPSCSVSHSSATSQSAVRSATPVSSGRSRTACRWARSRSEGVWSTLARTDAHEVLDRGGPDLAVTDLTGACGFDDGVDDARYSAVLDDELEAHLGDEVDDILSTSVDLGVPALPAMPLHLAHGHPGDA